MDVLELPSMGSMPLDLALPSPWDSDRVMAEAVFGPCSGDADGLTEAGNLYEESSTTGPQEIGFYIGGNAYMTGSSWSVHALKSSDTSSETSSVLLETSGWAPTTNHSGSCVQSSDSGSESLPAPLDVPGSAVGTGRTHRCRARRSQHLECGEEPEVARRHQRPRYNSDAQVQTLEPTPPAPARKAPRQREDWSVHKGPTLSGVVRPFESIKGTSLLSGSRTLEQINMALKGYQAA